MRRNISKGLISGMVLTVMLFIAICICALAVAGVDFALDLVRDEC